MCLYGTFSTAGENKSCLPNKSQLPDTCKTHLELLWSFNAQNEKLFHNLIDLVFPLQIVTVKEMSAFNRHVRMHSMDLSEEGQRTCDTCHKIFENKNKLLQHENLTHKKGKQGITFLSLELVSDDNRVYVSAFICALLAVVAL